jgi:hypothetical protein
MEIKNVWPKDELKVIKTPAPSQVLFAVKNFKIGMH